MRTNLMLTTAIALTLAAPLIALAQDKDRIGSKGAQIQVEQAHPEVEVQQPRPEVQVQQPEPKVSVGRAAPKVTVNQKKPEVIVKQPEPDITVRQAEPEVNAQQAKPDVSVERSEPDVSVEQADPEVEVESAGDLEVEHTQADAGIEGDKSEQPTEREGDGQPGELDEEARANQGVLTPPAGGQDQAAAPLPGQPGATAEVETTDAIPADDLIGRTVIGADGEKLGEVNDILLSGDGETEHVVVASGGFLGMGERKVAIPWSEAEASSNAKEIRITMTKEEFQSASEYERAESDSALVEASDK